MDFWISHGFQDFGLDFWISGWISVPVYEISRVSDPSVWLLFLAITAVLAPFPNFSAF